MIKRKFAIASFCIWAITPFTSAQVELKGPTGYSPPVAEASDEGEKAIRRFQKPEDMEISLFAAEPMLVNPVAFTIDYQGRVYVAETFRHHAGVSDMRGHRSWLVDDLANRTVEERLVTMEKNLGDDFAGYSGEHDRIKQITDTDGDGKADRSTIFADGFSNTLDGIGSSVLMDRGKLFYTCIPDLWSLEDKDDDGHVDARESLSHGYGVHINFLGHDSHGLRKGPDGRIYFSIGDRGFHVTNKEGLLLDYPDTGAVLRCFPDGTGLEVVHTGLRNPQELAFDAYGNLFTGDNNSDGGDQARWVYIVDGGDSGWTIGWQWITYPNPRGPWNSEKMWHPYHEGQPAHIVPPIQNIGSGPSGLTYYPGTGLPDLYENYFFMCDFRGDPNNSLIHAIQVDEDGAGFMIADRHDFVKQMLVTDCDFGMDGGMYATDWVAGWDKPQKGRIYRIAEPGVEERPEVQETKTLLADGMVGRSTDELVKLLGHVDMRVRNEAQFALADHGAKAVANFQQAIASDDQFTRLHGVWGLWQLLIADDIDGQELVALLSHQDRRVRAQAARALGEAKNGLGQSELIAMLSDPESRPRFFATTALGLQGQRSKVAAQAIVAMLKENANRDPYMRHAGVVGLTGTTPAAKLASLSNYSDKAVRLAAVLALRRMESAKVAEFMNDDDAFIQEEVVRAIHDGHITDAYPALTQQTNIPWENMAYARRIINALYRTGDKASAEALAGYAVDETVPETIRLEALKNLMEWEQPPALDRVNGMWRPLEPRALDFSEDLKISLMNNALSSDTVELQLAAMTFVQTYKVSSADHTLYALLSDKQFKKDVRIAALKALGSLNTKLFEKAIHTAMEAKSSTIRLAGIEQLAKLDPVAAVPLLDNAINSGSTSEKQTAFKALGSIAGADAEAVLLNRVNSLAEGKADKEIQVDIIEAAEVSPSKNVKEAIDAYHASFTDPESIAKYLPALDGGDKRRGRDIFEKKASTQCMRCHSVSQTHGSEVGPDLSTVAERLNRRQILEAVALPNATIAEGFENIFIELKSGDEVAGRVVKDDETTLVLELDSAEMARLATSKNPHSIVDVVAENTPEAQTQVAFDKAEIVDQWRDISSMPGDLVSFLSMSELRDLVEYLANQK